MSCSLRKLITLFQKKSLPLLKCSYFKILLRFDFSSLVSRSKFVSNRPSAVMFRKHKKNLKCHICNSCASVWNLQFLTDRLDAAVSAQEFRVKRRRPMKRRCLWMNNSWKDFDAVRCIPLVILTY